MSMKVHIISKESIKPSSPTPSHLRTFNFSVIDQTAPPHYVHILLFYANNGDNNRDSVDIHNCLKTSLSETLTSLYPIAGRINGNMSIDCNDEGAEYVEAQVHGQLSDVITHPNVVDVQQMLMPDAEPHYGESETGDGIGSKVVLVVQVNVFDCGGIVISVCLSHKVSDVCSLATFVNCWAVKALNSDEVIHPISVLSSVFPKKNVPAYIPSVFMYKGTKNIVTKRFVFEPSKIASLRAKASDTSYGTYPTRVEAVSAFIWRRFIALAQAKYKLVKDYTAVFAVNMRGRMVPPPSSLVGHNKNTLLGNVFCSTTTIQKVEDKIESHVLVGKIRDATRKIDSEYVQRLQCGDTYFTSFMKNTEDATSTGEMGHIVFSSWCRFPFYEADFGWGKPKWVSTTGYPYKDLIILLDTPSGDGIEAWVNMLEEDMIEIQQDKEFLEFVSSIPSA